MMNKNKVAEEITVSDIKKFYSILSSYDVNSVNVGVIGGDKAFDKLIRKNKIFKRKHTQLILNDDKTKLILFDTESDTEIDYIRVDTFADLQGKKFKRFI